MAQKRDLYIDQGTTFSQTLTVDRDYTGYTGTAQLRKYFTASASYPLTVTPGNGTIIVAMANTASARVPAGRYVYDIKLVGANTTIRAYEGVVHVTPAVTR